jgi:hypothetical protein
MSKVFTHMTMSLDGYIAEPDDGIGELFEWYEAGDVSVASPNESIRFAVDEVCVSLVPVLFGEGIPYFAKLGRGHVLLEDPVVVQGRRALHLRYPVRR